MILRNYLTLTFLTISVSVFGQKFMVQGEDTMLYKVEIVVQTDTLHLSENAYYPGDTLYEVTCHTFEKINGKIVNQSDDQCLRQGTWITTDSLGNYWTGNYHNSDKEDVWKQFDKEGKLLKEIEEISFGKDTYRVKEIDYTSGKPVTVVNRAFFSFYMNNLVAIIIILFGTFFGRVFINSIIYNIENETNFSPIYFQFPGFIPKNWEHSMLSTFTLWFYNYKQESRRLVLISNTMSVIALVIFFGILIGLGINGEL